MGVLVQLGATSLSYVFGALILTGVLYALGFVAYQLWFHPLAKYPGPFLGRITNLHSAYYAWRGCGHLHIVQCHEKYGPYVRIAPGRLLVNSTTGIKTIYSYSKDFQKSQVYNLMVHRAPNTLTAIDKKAHGRKRRILSQGLSEAAIRSYEPIILEQIHKLCDIWARLSDMSTAVPEEKQAAWSIPQNMARWANYLTFDIMSSVIFGATFDLLSKEDNRYVPAAIEASNVRTVVVCHAPILRFRRWDRKLFKVAIQNRNRFLTFVTGLLQERMVAKSQPKADAFSFLLQATDPETGERMTPAELGAEATTLVVAGSDTSSTALAAFFFYIVRHAEAYARAAAEVRNAFDDSTPVRLGASLSGCTYLSACIDEAMRLCPPAATALWRETTAPVMVDGHLIPAGVDVGTSAYAVQHDAEYFPEPYAFRPERWLPENRTPAAQSAFVPFSVGPRSCVGKALAKAELMLTAAIVLRRFDFETAPGLDHVGAGSPSMGPGRQRVGEYQLIDHITCAKDGPMLRFRERSVVVQ